MNSCVRRFSRQGALYYSQAIERSPIGPRVTDRPHRLMTIPKRLLLFVETSAATSCGIGTLVGTNVDSGIDAPLVPTALSHIPHPLRVESKTAIHHRLTLAGAACESACSPSAAGPSSFRTMGQRG
jgi:hypothetical protein